MDRVDSARGPTPATTSPSGPTVRRTVTLPPDPGSPARARHLLREALVGRRPDCLDAAELACTELVTNAVLHAHTTIDVTVEVGVVVRVEVRDRNPSLPTRRHYDPHATTGRGLALVAALTDEHGVIDAGTAGKTMWFTVGHGPLERTAEELVLAWDTADWDVDLLDRALRAPVATRPVRLLAMPSALWLAARQHHDALLRELALYATWHDDLDVDLVATDRARGAISGAVAAAVDRQRVTADHRGDGAAPLAWQPLPVDLELDVPEGSAQDFAAMQDTLDAAEGLAHAGQLLARPGLPEILAVRDWACDQVVAQLAGVRPARWPGTDDERFSHAVDDRPGAELHGFDVDAVRRAAGCVVAADDSNRIVAVSEPMARLVGTGVDGLVGRRIVALVPHRFREAHVAGFSRHLSTGEVHVIGVPITVPVLRADGTEAECRLLIERSAIAHGRAMYVATFGPAAGGTP